jgi:hypothetical protein
VNAFRANLRGRTLDHRQDNTVMRIPMIANAMRVAALAGAFALFSFAALAKPAPYDGSWHMQLVTTSGHCGVIDMGMAVAGGHISATSGKFVMHKIFLNGLIWGSGTAKINGVAGPRQAVGTGRFTHSKGKGKWNGTGPSGVCSGYWVAVRA